MKKTSIIYRILIVLALNSNCTNNSETPTIEIAGAWVCIYRESLSPIVYDSGKVFSEAFVYETSPYIMDIQCDSIEFSMGIRKGSKYYGQFAPYDINGDMLRYYDPASKNWVEFLISKPSPEILLLTSTQKETSIYKKANDTLINPLDINNIYCFHKDVCNFVNCRTFEILIQNDGMIYLHGLEEFEYKGFFVGKINMSYFHYLADKLSRANVLELDSCYIQSQISHGIYERLVVEADGKIKSIEKYSGASYPRALKLAMIPISNLHQISNFIEMDSIKGEKIFKKFNKLSSTCTLQGV